MEYRVFNLTVSGILFILLGLPFFITDGSTGTRNILGVNLPACRVRDTLGRPCITCGLTTSVLAHYRGDWRKARIAHEGGIWWIALLCFQLGLRPLSQRFHNVRGWIIWLDLGQLFAMLVVWRWIVVPWG